MVSKNSCSTEFSMSTRLEWNSKAQCTQSHGMSHLLQTYYMSLLVVLYSTDCHYVAWTNRLVHRDRGHTTESDIFLFKNY